MRKETEMQPGLPRFLPPATDGPCRPSLRQKQFRRQKKMMRLGQAEGKNMKNKHNLDNFFYRTFSSTNQSLSSV